MNPPGAGERGTNNHLFVEAVPVWYSRNGRVNPDWLSACEEERNLTSHLMERIADSLNVTKAYQKVVSNGGASGVDGMKVEELKEWLGKNLSHLQEQLLTGSYQPQAVKGVQIPKPNGGKRQLGIPTVTDRLIQQSIHQVLSVGYEKIFSENSYGFRPNKNAHQALKQAGKYLAQGKSYVIDLDLEKFFDEVNHHRLMWLLSTRICDRRVLGTHIPIPESRHDAGGTYGASHQRHATRQSFKSTIIQYCFRRVGQRTGTKRTLLR
jgi:hypothetical protein